MTPQSYSPGWLAPLAPGPLGASVELPGSKSLNNRELVLSALAASPTRLLGALESRDSSLMMAALTALGTGFEHNSGAITVIPSELRGPANIDCGLAGTVMRFVPPVAALATGEISFDGDAAARLRPMLTTIESLGSLGVRVSGSGLPFTIFGTGSVQGGEVSIDASASSQFVSGLLLAGARFENGLTLHHKGEKLPSMPHIEMTIACLNARGVQASQVSEASWRVEPGEIAGGEIQIEPDLSNAGPFLAAALVAGGSVKVLNWPKQTTQVGDQFDGILQQLGAQVKRSENDLEVIGSGEIHGIDIDLSEAGELTPVIAALAALADSPSRIRGVAHLRGHETDRLKALVNEINSLGGNATEQSDGLSVIPSKLKGGLWSCYQDHRMATAGAIIGLRVPGVVVEDIEATSKTIPQFVSLWESMLGESA